MGSVYRRGDSPFLWLGYTDAAGKRRLASSGTADLEVAKGMLAALEARVRAERASGLGGEGPVTVRRYAEKWLAERAGRVPTATDDAGRLRHALPVIGHLALKDVRPQHLRDLIRELVKVGQLAPRSVLHVYGVLRVMFSDATVEGLIPASPAVLRQRRAELPKKRDKDPRWRASAVFERQEVEALISDERIPERQRALYALEFLCGVRVNEVTPRRWCDYDAVATPLGKLTFATSYALKRKLEKEPKTGHAREVPVHPTLARVLAQWKLHGWAAYYGRLPEAGDLIVPARAHAERPSTRERASRRFLNSTVELEGLHESLALLGLRKRRQHDFRRTFITLGQVDGGRREVLETITHDPKGDMTSLYTTWPWPTRCEAVARLNVRLREGQLVRLAPTEGATWMLRSTEGAGMTEPIFGQGGTRSRPPPPPEDTHGAPSVGNVGVTPIGSILGAPQEAQARSNVAAGEDPSGYEAQARRLGMVEVFRSGA